MVLFCSAATRFECKWLAVPVYVSSLSLGRDFLSRPFFQEVIYGISATGQSCIREVVPVSERIVTHSGWRC